MAILEKFTKQAIEVEIYAIQFAEDMAPTDSISGGHVLLTHQGKSKGTLNLSAPYAATLADDHKSLCSSAAISLPNGVPDGYTLYVGNVNQSAGITAGSFNIAARSCAIIVYRAGNWLCEASGQGIVVAAPGDQRIRIIFAGGTDGNNYKAELTASTAEGRVMQDELIIKVRES